VIAEGVEEQEELDMLRAISVPWAQGFYLGSPHRLPPAPAEPTAPFQPDESGEPMDGFGMLDPAPSAC
jgi:EAL domain-containing protein (putative c-di-GMP-specific phosphodiesterase class I)